MQPSTLRAGLAALALLCPSASAEFLAAQTPAFRGQPCTTFGSWETFTSAHAGANAPDVAGSTASATITQLTPGAILTSTGNIYHPSATPVFRLDDAVAADVQEVILQTATLGNPRDPGSATLTYLDASAQPVVLFPAQIVTLLSNVPTREELWFRWDLSAVADEVLGYSIEWSGTAANSSLTSVLLDVRTDCPAGVAECFGDGSGAACPCGNAGAAGHGCANSVNPAGANLAATGGASVGFDTVTLRGSGMPNSSALYFQGTTALSSPFGDGLRCAGGSVIRLGMATNAGGASRFPEGAQAPVSVAGAVGAGDVRVYQVWYRNAASYCTPSTFNLTNAVRVTWQG